MSKQEEALRIIDKKDVDVALLKKCFGYSDDPFLLKYEPDMCRGLYNYNNNYEDGKYYRTPLTIKEYKLLKEVLTWRK